MTTTLEKKKTDSLAIRRYGEGLGDFQMVDGWIKVHGGCGLPETLLPAVGVIVEMGGEPAAAMWLYMDNSIGVCWLDCAATMPGLGVGRARACLAEAVKFLTAEAARLGYGACFCYCHEAVARHLECMGFSRREYGLVMMERRID